MRAVERATIFETASGSQGLMSIASQSPLKSSMVICSCLGESLMVRGACAVVRVKVKKLLVQVYYKIRYYKGLLKIELLDQITGWGVVMEQN